VFRLVQLKGGRAGIRLVIGPHTEPDQIGAEIDSVLGGAAQFLGRTRLQVEIPDETLTPPLVQAITEAVARFPNLSLAGISGTRGHAAAARGSEPRVVRRTVRSGQEVVCAGDLVVLGDVHVGGRVVASGDVIVVGALRGFAWAGAEGDESRIIYAQPLQPTQVRIASSIAQGGRTLDSESPEYAHLESGRIVVEPWLPTGRRAPHGVS